MGGDVLGGGVIIAVAAMLWLIYLVPTWWRRREYLATERNAVRLQQTLRILAETADVPDEVRVGAFSREVAAQQRALREQEDAARQEAEEAIAAAALAARQARAAQKAAMTPATRTRRTRAATSLVLLASLAGSVAGAVVAGAGGGVFLLLVALAGVTGASVTLVVLAKVSPAARRVTPVRTVFAPPAPVFEPVELAADAPRESTPWMPKPLPKPLHLSPGSAAANTVASVDAQQRLRRAAMLAAMEERSRSEGAEPAPARLRPRPADVPAASSGSTPGMGAGGAVNTAASAGVGSAASRGVAGSRWANMGMVAGVEPGGMSDLDAVLRRRRAAG